MSGTMASTLHIPNMEWISRAHLTKENKATIYQPFGTCVKHSRQESDAIQLLVTGKGAAISRY